MLSYATKSITLEKASTLQEAMNLQRKEIEIEKTFEFIGIIVMDNQLKPITKLTISELNKAKMTSIMATGDNIHTAICVAKKCGILYR